MLVFSLASLQETSSEGSISHISLFLIFTVRLELDNFFKQRIICINECILTIFLLNISNISQASPVIRPFLKQSQKFFSSEAKGSSKKILFFASSFNGLCQRSFVELKDKGHDIAIELSPDEDKMIKAVEKHKPDLVLCPFLKHRVPQEIWDNVLSIIIHPGIKGDRGASSLDWAISNEMKQWGVTALEASEEMDAGDIWSTVEFPLEIKSKASLYRQDVTDSAMDVISNVILITTAHTNKNVFYFLGVLSFLFSLFS